MDKYFKEDICELEFGIDLKFGLIYIKCWFWKIWDDKGDWEVWCWNECIGNYIWDWGVS